MTCRTDTSCYAVCVCVPKSHKLVSKEEILSKYRLLSEALKGSSSYNSRSYSRDSQQFSASKEMIMALLRSVLCIHTNGVHKQHNIMQIELLFFLCSEFLVTIETAHAARKRTLLRM